MLPDEHIPVAFAQTAQLGRTTGLGRPSIVIVPDHNTWNDFGYRLYADMYVLLSDREEMRSIRLMFEGEGNTATYLDTLFAVAGPVVHATNIPKRICSLQRKTENYRDLVAEVGFARAVAALRILGDAVLLTLEDNDPARLALIRSERFHAAMVRNAEEYRAFRRGGQHLRASPVAEVEDAATLFKLRPPLPGGDLLDPLAFDFEPDLLFDDRVGVLIGRNGIGKTQSLLALIRGLTTSDTAAAGALNPIPEVRRVLMFSSVPSDPYPKSILPWLGIDYEYHPVAIDTFPLGRPFILSLVDCARDAGALFGSDEEGRDRHRLLRNTLRDLGMWDGLHVPLTSPPEGSDDQFKDTVQLDGVRYYRLDNVGGEYRTATFLNRIDLTRPAVVLHTSGEPRHLSSGELVMLQFAAQAIAAIERGSLLLFDEPETHLHPNYVSEFMDLLQELLKRTQSIAIIATHSAYVVREVPRRRVIILRQTDGGIEVVQPRLQTFGANVDAVSQFVFGDTLISHRYQRVLKRWANTQGRALGLDGVIKYYGEELNPETLSFIARVIDEPPPER
jgi:energy-coupling factor transporter ATP-binding protein EcfA2